MSVRSWFRRRIDKVRARIRWMRAPEAYKRQVAVHEAGHVLAAWLLPTFREIAKATVLPEGDFRGYTLALHVLSSPPERVEIEHLMTMGMAGAAAERLLLGSCDVGSADDLIHVLAWGISYRYGMPYRSALGISASLVMDMLTGDPAEKFSAQLYAIPLLGRAAARAVDLLGPRRADLVKVANLLRRRKTIEHRHLERLLGPRPA